MTVAIYASLLALLLCWLTLNVVKSRRKNKVRYADGGIEELKIARAAHSNATETIPITLIMMFFLEFNGATIWLIHVLGIVFVLGRVIHCRSILSGNLKGRALGMHITIYSIIALAILNLFYLPYAKFLAQ